jgi:hypothetical protein
MVSSPFLLAPTPAKLSLSNATWWIWIVHVERPAVYRDLHYKTLHWYSTYKKKLYSKLNMVSSYSCGLQQCLYCTFKLQHSQRSWLQIQRSRVRSPPLPDYLRSSGSGTGSTHSLVSTTEELLERKSSRFGLDNREYGHRDPRDTLYPQKLPLTSPTSGRRPVRIVRSRTKATEFVF